MSADAATLPCPICSHAGVFDSAQSLRDRLIQVSTNKLLCPVCQEEICGLDKLTIHLFSHVKILSNNQSSVKMNCTNHEIKSTLKSDNITAIQPKKPRSAPKNKSVPTTANSPMKYVKIYPRLPVISLNSVPLIDISQKSSEESATKNETVYIAGTEVQNNQPNTTCNICGLQFVDCNILKMHRCLIHNIDEPSSQTFTRYNCHLCPKNFKMRGSLMVHLRVAHFGFLSSISNSERNTENKSETGNIEDQDKSLIIDRNDNKQWQCDVCRKYFTTKYFLKKHKRLHTGETPYACTQCNKTFTFQQSYHKHLLYHNDEKPHTCSYCGRAFKELSTLHNHQRIHTGEKPFACETCGKCFRQRVSYLVHRRIHTGVMPYKCTACDKSFRYKVSQRTHKCQAQPPGTVIRQTGDLVEKLKKKHADADYPIKEETKEKEIKTQNITYCDVSAANVELVRTGAQLSLEDMESENFRIIADPFSANAPSISENSCSQNDIGILPQKLEGVFDTNIDELINNIPIEDKDVPSPSEIFKNLCLTKDDDFNII